MDSSAPHWRQGALKPRRVEVAGVFVWVVMVRTPVSDEDRAEIAPREPRGRAQREASSVEDGIQSDLEDDNPLFHRPEIAEFRSQPRRVDSQDGQGLEHPDDIATAEKHDLRALNLESQHRVVSGAGGVRFSYTPILASSEHCVNSVTDFLLDFLFGVVPGPCCAVHCKQKTTDKEKTRAAVPRRSGA